MRLFAVVLASLMWASPASAGEPALTISSGGKTVSFTRDALLARADARTIEVVKDATYGGPMTYSAVPVAELLAGLDFPKGSVVEAVAVDGFAAQIPLALMENTDASKPVGWIAVEPAGKPWPKIGGKDYTAGPFYIVWTGADLSAIRSEYWAYQTAKLESQELPVSRWPRLAVDDALAPGDPSRLGQAVYLAQCLPCHKINGGGSSDVGPDLNLPMNPTEYMTEAGLRRLIRDPKSVRTWPAQRMTGFSPAHLSDADLDLLLAYLKHMAGRKSAPAAQNP